MLLLAISLVVGCFGLFVVTLAWKTIVRILTTQEYALAPRLLERSPYV